MKRKMLRMVVLMLLSILITMGISACGNQFHIELEEAESETKEDLIVVGVSQVGSESVWRNANTESLEQTFCKENGYFMIFDNAMQKQENQIKAIRRFISQRVDYIVFSPITEKGWDTVLEEAKTAGIPVIIMDRKVDVKNKFTYTAWVGSDFNKEGQDAGEWLEDYLRGTKFGEDQVDIVVLKGTAGSSATIGRSAGFKSVALENKNWNIMAELDGDFTTTKAKEEMQKFIEKNGDRLDVVVSQNDDMTFGALEALQEAGYTTGTGGDIIVISFDASLAALEKVKTGIINVDVECNPLQGPYIAELIETLQNGESVDRDNYVTEKVFTQKNVLSVLNDRTY